MFSNLNSSTEQKASRFLKAYQISEDIFSQVQIQIQGQDSQQQTSKKNQNKEYLEFYKTKFHEIKCLFPGKNPNEITKLISLQWKNHKKQGKSSVGKSRPDTQSNKQHEKADRKLSQSCENQTPDLPEVNNLDILQRIRDTKFSFEVENHLSFQVDGQLLLQKILEGKSNRIDLLIQKESICLTNSEPFNREINKLVVAGLDDLISSTQKKKIKTLKEEVQYPGIDNNNEISQQSSDTEDEEILERLEEILQADSLESESIQQSSSKIMMHKGHLEQREEVDDDGIDYELLRNLVDTEDQEEMQQEQLNEI